jgi:hypothetical protein
MPVDRPSLEIRCECLSEDVKRVFKDMVRSHNAHLSNRLQKIREDIRFNKEFDIPRSYDFTEVMLDREAEILLEQKLMEDLQDYLEDLPTCFEFHHGR